MWLAKPSPRGTAVSPAHQPPEVSRQNQYRGVGALFGTVAEETWDENCLPAPQVVSTSSSSPSSLSPERASSALARACSSSAGTWKLTVSFSSGEDANRLSTFV